MITLYILTLICIQTLITAPSGRNNNTTLTHYAITLINHSYQQNVHLKARGRGGVCCLGLKRSKERSKESTNFCLFSENKFQSVSQWNVPRTLFTENSPCARVHHLHHHHHHLELNHSIHQDPKIRVQHQQVWEKNCKNSSCVFYEFVFDFNTLFGNETEVQLKPHQ